MQKTIACIIGTRPEAIKMAPVVLAVRKLSWLKPVVILTAQHRELADEVLNLFEIEPDVDLNLMQPNQTLADFTARAIMGLDNAIDRLRPDIIMAQGDTTTVMASALISFYRHAPFLHLEAGLRSHDLQNPFPEEFNRIIASRVAALHFAPTEGARRQLMNEGVADSHIVLTGNTVIDALYLIARRKAATNFAWIDPRRRLILITVHRRESFGQPLKNICRAFLTIAENNPDVELLWPVHPNPNVQREAHYWLSNHPRIRLIKPLNYESFVYAMAQSTLILTDSGGVQEEAPALSKPVLVLRNETERPDAIDAGVARLIGTEYETIVRETQTLLHSTEAYNAMIKGLSPYGDGRAAERIVRAIEERWNL